MRLLCWLGFHKRSKGRAHYDDSGYVSVCRRCERPMTKQRDGKWVIGNRH